MTNRANQDPEVEELAKRRVPCMVAYLQPFRLVNGPDSTPWHVTIDEVNGGSWDYVALHELVGGIDVGLEPPYHMVVCRDGAVGLPTLPHLRSDQQAVEFFNRCLSALLIGGVYCEAIALDGLDFGSIIDWKYLRVHGHGSAAANRFHNLVRLKRASALEAISLMKPREVGANDLTSAMALGRDVLAAVNELSPEFLLKGTTAFAKRDWGSALANLWIVVEQVTSNLWTRYVLQPAKQGTVIDGRADQLADFRTWTTAARHELLHQIDIITPETLAKLSRARKARNDLAHKGKHPTAAAARAAREGAADLLTIATDGRLMPLLAPDLDAQALPDPFNPEPSRPLDPQYWMEIFKLPGEEELERLEAESYRRYRRAGKGRT